MLVPSKSCCVRSGKRISTDRCVCDALCDFAAFVKGLCGVAVRWGVLMMGRCVCSVCFDGWVVLGWWVLCLVAIGGVIRGWAWWCGDC